MGTGRSDYPNQINNVLAFPGIFRGALDARASDITEGMKLAAAEAIAESVSDDELTETTSCRRCSTGRCRCGSPRRSPLPRSPTASAASHNVSTTFASTVLHDEFGASTVKIVVEPVDEPA